MDEARRVGAGRGGEWGVDLLAVSMCQQQVPRPCTESERGRDLRQAPTFVDDESASNCFLICCLRN